eukprot:Nk52_evm12s2449 gene=Nk52_evmTU12s2449
MNQEKDQPFKGTEGEKEEEEEESETPDIFDSLLILLHKIISLLEEQQTNSPCSTTPSSPINAIHSLWTDPGAGSTRAGVTGVVQGTSAGGAVCVYRSGYSIKEIFLELCHVVALFKGRVTVGAVRGDKREWISACDQSEVGILGDVCLFLLETLLGCVLGICRAEIDKNKRRGKEKPKGEDGKNIEKKGTAFLSKMNIFVNDVFMLFFGMETKGKEEEEEEEEESDKELRDNTSDGLVPMIIQLWGKENTLPRCEGGLEKWCGDMVRVLVHNRNELTGLTRYVVDGGEGDKGSVTGFVKGLGWLIYRSVGIVALGYYGVVGMGEDLDNECNNNEVGNNKKMKEGGMNSRDCVMPSLMEKCIGLLAGSCYGGVGEDPGQIDLISVLLNYHYFNNITYKKDKSNEEAEIFMMAILLHSYMVETCKGKRGTVVVPMGYSLLFAWKVLLLSHMRVFSNVIVYWDIKLGYSREVTGGGENNPHDNTEQVAVNRWARLSEVMGRIRKWWLADFEMLLKGLQGYNGHYLRDGVPSCGIISDVEYQKEISTSGKGAERKGQIMLLSFRGWNDFFPSPNSQPLYVPSQEQLDRNMMRLLGEDNGDIHHYNPVYAKAETIDRTARNMLVHQRVCWVDCVLVFLHNTISTSDMFFRAKSFRIFEKSLLPLLFRGASAQMAMIAVGIWNFGINPNLQSHLIKAFKDTLLKLPSEVVDNTNNPNDEQNKLKLAHFYQTISLPIATYVLQMIYSDPRSPATNTPSTSSGKGGDGGGGDGGGGGGGGGGRGGAQISDTQTHQATGRFDGGYELVLSSLSLLRLLVLKYKNTKKEKDNISGCSSSSSSSLFDKHFLQPLVEEFLMKEFDAKRAYLQPVQAHLGNMSDNNNCKDQLQYVLTLDAVEQTLREYDSVKNT